MNKQERAEYANALKQSIDATTAEIAMLTELVKPISPENAIGRLTRMEAINTKSINEATLRLANNRLQGLNRALTHIDDPDLGLCHSCDNPIPFKRLLLTPESTECVKCLEERE